MLSHVVARKHHLERWIAIMTLGTTTCSCFGPVSYPAGIRDLKNLGLVNVSTASLYLTPIVLKRLLLRNFNSTAVTFGLKPTEFSSMLSSTNSIVAGSLALHCITGDTLEKGIHRSDIDIYVHYGNRGQT